LEEKTDVPKREIEKTVNNLVSKESKQIDSKLGNNGSEKSNRFNSTDIIVPPDLQKADKFIVQPSYFVRKRSMGAKASKMIDSLKEKTDEAVDYSKKDEQNNSKWIPLMGSDAEVEKTIPLYAEQLMISKKIVKVGDIIIRKKEVTTREKIDVHIIKEKIFVENPGEKGNIPKKQND
jgi:hypothetical protein